MICPLSACCVLQKPLVLIWLHGVLQDKNAARAKRRSCLLQYVKFMLTHVAQMRDRARRFITLLDELYNARTRLCLLAAASPHHLFRAADGNAHDEPILDLEMLQSEGAVPGARLRQNVCREGGVAPLAGSAQAQQRLTAHLGGAEEQFAFARAVSRLLEMHTARYWALRPRGG